MVKTKTRHDSSLIFTDFNMQSNVVEPLTIKTPFYSDESITSWLMRASFNQGCSPLIFTQFYWGKRRLWTYDVDKGFNHIDSTIHQNIAILADLEPKLVESHTLLYYAIKLNTLTVSDKMNSQWVLPLSKRNRSSLLGYFYCPLCMADEKNAYLSIFWRFSWYIYCEHHLIDMQNMCTFCGMPYQPNLIKVQQRYLNQCHYCQKSLAQPKIKNLFIDENALHLQKKALIVLKADKATVFNQEISASEWFELILFYINLVRKASKAQKTNFLTYRLIRALGIEVGCGAYSELKDSLTGLQFDYLPLEERRRFISYAQALSLVTLDKWLIACEIVGVSKNSFHWSKSTVIPTAFLPVYSQLSINSKKSRKVTSSVGKPNSRKSVEMAWQRLQRKAQMRLYYTNN